jgi:hypothetical protein
MWAKNNPMGDLPFANITHLGQLSAIGFWQAIY